MLCTSKNCVVVWQFLVSVLKWGAQNSVLTWSDMCHTPWKKFKLISYNIEQQINDLLKLGVFDKNRSSVQCHLVSHSFYIRMLHDIFGHWYHTSSWNRDYALCATFFVISAYNAACIIPTFLVKYEINFASCLLGLKM